MLLTLTAALRAETLTPVPTRDNKIVKRWQLPGDPHGIAVAGGILYVGLAQPQAVVAIDAKTGAVVKRVVLDNPDIAATKDLVTLRINAAGTRLYTANGSDESASILSLPDLTVIREITMEGEAIRDALPDPKGRFLYLLGRRVHVFDADGKTELKTLPFDDPMAIAATAGTLAIVGPENFGNTKADVVALYDPATWNEVARDPLQTDKAIEAALFADDGRALMAVSRDALFEKPIVTHAPKQMSASSGGAMRMTIDFGDLTNSEHICLPEGSGPQIATMAPGDVILLAERRCTASGAFSGSSRRVTPASLYGVNAYALAYDKASNTLAVTDRAGYLTIYKVPRAATIR